MSIERSLKAAKRFQEERERERAEVREHQVLHAPPAHDESNWLVSYADMMTLLCGFFIMLFSMSRLDAPQYEAVKKSVAEQFGGKYHHPSETLAEQVSQVIQEQGIQKDAIIRPDPFGVSVIFESEIFFDTLSSNIRPEGSTAMNKLITAVKQLQNKTKQTYRIMIEGHTDSRPIVGGIYPSNWELSAARAAGVVRQFLSSGFDAKSLVAIGYADTRPDTSFTRLPTGEWDLQNLAKNRRVVVRILNPGAESLPFQSSNLGPSGLKKTHSTNATGQKNISPSAVKSVIAPPQIKIPNQ